MRYVVTGKIHRAEYTVAKAKQFLKKKSPNMIVLKLPKRWNRLAEKITPSPEEARKFEELDISADKGYGEDRKESMDIADSEGWKYLGCGVHRCAFKLPNGSVLKVAKPEHYGGYVGRDANKYEIVSYLLSSDEVKDILVPIVAHSPTYHWMVVPAARTQENDSLNYDDMREIQREIHDRIGKMGAYCADIHYGNIGLLDGNPVIIDSGFGISCARAPLPAGQKRLDETEEESFWESGSTRIPSIEPEESKHGMTLLSSYPSPAITPYSSPLTTNPAMPLKGMDTLIKDVQDNYFDLQTTIKPKVRNKIIDLIAIARDAYEAGESDDAHSAMSEANSLLSKAKRGWGGVRGHSSFLRVRRPRRS